MSTDFYVDVWAYWKYFFQAIPLSTFEYDPSGCLRFYDSRKKEETRLTYSKESCPE